jgi:Ca2+-binding RTX toxin-like protein
MLQGDGGDDEIYGGSQSDANGRPCDLKRNLCGDRLYGDHATREIADGGNDAIHGQSDGDLLVGEAGADSLHGGEGPDVLRDFLGANLLFGGPDGDDCDSAAAGDDQNNRRSQCER